MTKRIWLYFVMKNLGFKATMILLMIQLSKIMLDDIHAKIRLLWKSTAKAEFFDGHLFKTSRDK